MTVNVITCDFPDDSKITPLSREAIKIKISSKTGFKFPKENNLGSSDV